MTDLNYDGPEGGGFVKTGPVSGSVRLADGTVYDVTPEFVRFEIEGHGHRIAHHIAKIHEASGRLEAMTGSAVHTCTEECGDEAGA